MSRWWVVIALMMPADSSVLALHAMNSGFYTWRGACSNQEPWKTTQ
jgi:hypothetical protein